MSEEPLKFKVSRMYELCKKLWPEEFSDMFSAEKEDFRDWLNHKTGLDEDHISNKAEAMVKWVDALECMARGK